MASLPPPPRQSLGHAQSSGGQATFAALTRAGSASIALAALLLIALLLLAVLRAPEVLPELASLRYNPGTGELGLGGLALSTMGSLLLGGLLAAPVALLGALWLAELGPPSWRRPLLALLDGAVAVPSVVVGLWVAVVGGALLERLLGPGGSGLLSASLVVAAMSAPTMARVAHAILEAVPDSLREGAIALGATRWEAVRVAVLPVAARGLVGAVVLGLSRALGETIAIAMVVGGRPSAAPAISGATGTLGSVLVDEYLDAFRTSHLATLSAAALVLLTLGAATHVASRVLVHSVARRPS
jgi:phosphate transport system permease protein